jgi:hypothetical protein
MGKGSPPKSSGSSKSSSSKSSSSKSSSSKSSSKSSSSKSSSKSSGGLSSLGSTDLSSLGSTDLSSLGNSLGGLGDSLGGLSSLGDSLGGLGGLSSLGGSSDLSSLANQDPKVIIDKVFLKIIPSQHLFYYITTYFSCILIAGFVYLVLSINNLQDTLTSTNSKFIDSNSSLSTLKYMVYIFTFIIHFQIFQNFIFMTIKKKIL